MSEINELSGKTPQEATVVLKRIRSKINMLSVKAFEEVYYKPIFDFYVGILNRIDTRIEEAEITNNDVSDGIGSDGLVVITDESIEVDTKLSFSNCTIQAGLANIAISLGYSDDEFIIETERVGAKAPKIGGSVSENKFQLVLKFFSETEDKRRRELIG